MNAMAAQPTERSALIMNPGDLGGQGADFAHERSPEPDALPLILICSTPARRAELIGPLTRPRAYGGDPADAFHVVIPTMLDLDWSAPLRRSGWEQYRVANAWFWLMHGLGYERYGAYGNDFGAYVSRSIGRVERGARFAASDGPEIVVADAREFFRRLR